MAGALTMISVSVTRAGVMVTVVVVGGSVVESVSVPTGPVNRVVTVVVESGAVVVMHDGEPVKVMVAVLPGAAVVAVVVPG